ncbi:hypothetical protein JCM8208_003792 [Rhodotorula glutinis]
MREPTSSLPLVVGSSLGDDLLPLSSFLKTTNAQSAQLHKDWASAISRLAKSADKRFGPPPPPLFPPPPRPPPPASLHPQLAALAPDPAAAATAASSSSSALDLDDPTPFSTPDVAVALNQTIATHLARLGAFDALSTFLTESGTPTPPELTDDLLAQLRELHAILADLRDGTCTRALDWVDEQGADADPGHELEYALRREEFVRIILDGASGDEAAAAAAAAARAGRGGASDAMETDTAAAAAPGPSEPRLGSLARRKSSLASLPGGSGDPSSAHAPPPPPHVRAALAYGGAHFRRLMTPARAHDICALLTCPLYLPLARLVASPYGALFLPEARARSTSALAAKFAAAFLKGCGLPSESPLTVVTDVGGGGALAKIMKVRAVMKEKRTEWSAVGELPVEIPLPLPYRFHSIFACPVSKEQSTAQNPPMLLPCGHVIARESLQRLARGTPTLKCPYCPVVSHMSACVRVHF